MKRERQIVVCPACGGDGEIPCVTRWGRGPYDCAPDVDTCGLCKGEGTVTAAEAAAHVEGERRAQEQIDAADREGGAS